MSGFWTNTIWYLLLAALSVAAFAAAMAKSDNRRFTVAFTLATVGLFYLFEFVLVTLNAYSYSPMIIPDNPFLETYIGNVFSQTSIAAVSVFIIAWRLRPYWCVIFAALFYAIELLFMGLGIYTVYWYKAFYTPLILVPLFYLLRLWHDRAALQNRAIDGFLLQFLGVLAVVLNTVTFPLRLFNLLVFTGGFFSDPSKDHTTTGIFIIIVLTGMLVMAWRTRRRCLWAPIALTAVFGIDFILWKAGLLAVPAPWFVAVALVQILGMYLWVHVVGNLVQARLLRQ